MAFAAAALALAEDGGQGAAVPAPGTVRSPSATRPPTAAELEGAVRAADTLVQQARFDEALDRTDRLRGELDGLGDSPEARRLRARNEVTAGTAHVALDQEQAARQCFRRALAAEPALDLDPAATAPKVLRVFRAVRAESRGSR
jgi:hypothetical protein